MSITKGSKMLQFINWSMRVTLDDTRVLVGRFLAFDKHMNLVLADCEEFRITKSSKKKRALGLVLLRGECVVSIAVESPPPKPKARPKLTKSQAPLGTGVPAGRGAPPPGLGPAAPTMYGQPQMYRGPPPMGRGMPPPGWMGMGRGYSMGYPPPGYGPPPEYGRGAPVGRGPRLPPPGRGPAPPPPLGRGAPPPVSVAGRGVQSPPQEVRGPPPPPAPP